jgi:hypothetical protein
MNAASVQLFGAPGILSMTPQALTGWWDAVPAHHHNVNRNPLFEGIAIIFGCQTRRTWGEISGCADDSLLLLRFYLRS